MSNISMDDLFLLEEFPMKQQQTRGARNRRNTNTCDVKIASFVTIGIITCIYVLVELAAGIYVNSLVLLSDGFHNLSDVIALYIAYWAQQAQKRDVSDEMSYGWARSEILGGLLNGVFLLSLCLYVLLESIPKFIEPEPIEAGILFICVAAAGLGVNTIGTVVFCVTGQGHTHSHGGGGHSHGHSHSHSHSKQHKEEGHSHSHSHSEESNNKKKKKKKRDLNVHAVFLHYLGDSISSCVVLIVGLIIHFFKEMKWTYYVDPLSSLFIIGLILATTYPLVKRCSNILLQSTPQEINMETIRTSICNLEGVVSLHDLHIWQLNDGMLIASVHVAVEEGIDFTALIGEVKSVFHASGVHSSSIQPEFVHRNFQDSSFCEQNCVKDCEEEWCCKKTADREKEFSIHARV